MLAEKILQIFSDDIILQFQALQDKGPHRIKAEYRVDFLIVPELAADTKHVKSRVCRLFPYSKADNIILRATDGKVSSQ